MYFFFPVLCPELKTHCLSAECFLGISKLLQTESYFLWNLLILWCLQSAQMEDSPAGCSWRKVGSHSYLPFTLRPSSVLTLTSYWLFLKTVSVSRPPLAHSPILSLSYLLQGLLAVASHLFFEFLSLLSYTAFSPPSSQNDLFKIEAVPLGSWLLMSLGMIAKILSMASVVLHNLSSSYLSELVSHSLPSCFFHDHTHVKHPLLP